MDESKLTRLLQSYFVLRDQLIPSGESRGSVMMRELLLHVLAAHVARTPLTLKRCYLTFQSATKVIRRDLRLLVADGLVEMKRSPRDRRSVLISPSDFTLARLEELASWIEDSAAPPNGANGSVTSGEKDFNPLIYRPLYAPRGWGGPFG